MTTNPIELSIVTPAYNEAEQLSSSVSRIVEVVEPLVEAFELIIVDDGSTDETWKVVQEVVQRNSSVRAVQLSRNFGKELAIAAGLENASGAACVVIDADLQHPPDYIREMFRLWKEENFQIVEAVKKSRQSESSAQRLSSVAFYQLMNLLTGYKLANATDFKLLDRSALEAWTSLQERNLFFRGTVAWIGFRRASVVIDVADREHGSSKWSTRALLRLALNAIVSFSTIPLRIIFVFGMIFLVVALVMALRALQLWFAGEAASGITTVILLQLFIGGILLTSLGVIGKYISMIYDEVKRRPRYLIADRIN